MNRTKVTTLFLFITLLVMGCHKETPEPENNEPQAIVTFNDNPIMYCNLEVGQKSAYVLLQFRPDRFTHLILPIFIL